MAVLAFVAVVTGLLPAGASSRPTGAVARVYDVRIVGSGKEIVTAPTQRTRTGHWTQTLPGLRLVIGRDTRGRWERVVFTRWSFEKGGSVTVTGDSGDPDCPSPATHRFTWSGVTLAQDPTYAALLLTADTWSGADPQGCVASIWAGLPSGQRGDNRPAKTVTPWGYQQKSFWCDLRPDYASLLLPTTRKKTARLPFPLDRIVAGSGFAVDVHNHYSGTNYSQTFSGRISFVLRKAQG